MKRLFDWSLTLALLVVPRPAGAQLPVAGAVNEARVAVRTYLEQQRVPGASVAVAVDGTIVWSEGFGHANLELRVPATPATRFRIGSISKTLTSVALARLWERGELDLDAAVQRYAPTFPVKAHPISTRELAGHLSGLPHYTREDIVNTVHYESVTDALRKFADRPLLFEPGERFSYSSYGWNLLSVVVEGASGDEFLAHMQRQVFEPFGMAATIADHYARIIENRTAFYVESPDSITVNAPAVDNSDVWAGGGFLSTSEDLVRFGDGVLGGRAIGDRGRRLLFTPMVTRRGDSTGYGFGWFVGDAGGRRAVGHGGSHVGATAQLIVLPDARVAVAMLTNSNSRGLPNLVAVIADGVARAVGR
jgi:CubicO group peptidase (beta-lactamase class C family)